MNDVIQLKFDEIKNRSAQFTLRAFADRLGVSPGALSEILAGKRAVTKKTAERIANRLALSPSDRAEFLSQLANVEIEYDELRQDQFKLVGEWWHFAIDTVRQLNIRPLIRLPKQRPRFAAAFEFETKPSSTPTIESF